MHEDPVTKSKRVTDMTGAPVSAVESDPFGADTTRSSNAAFQPRKYTTYERDQNGSDEATFRRYHGRHARFSQPDPYDGSYDLTDPQSLNRYAYVQNDPVNFVDPSGLNLANVTCYYGAVGVRRVGEGRLGFEMGYTCVTEGGGDTGRRGPGDLEPGGRGPAPQNPTPTQQPERNDCVNMANRAQEIANGVINGANAWRGTGARAMLQRFNRLFGTEFAGTYAGEGVLGMADMPLWGSSSQTRADFGQRGFPQQFRDSVYTDDAADQTHHFAAFFSAGLAGHNVFANAYRAWDTYTESNPGDANLGRQSQLLGRYLRNNPSQLRNVGQLIRDTICNGNPVPK